jgi:electron transport complex protein RnfD
MTLAGNAASRFSGRMPSTLYAPDALTGATPLDVLRTQLGLGLTVTEIRNSPVFGIVAGRAGNGRR